MILFWFFLGFMFVIAFGFVLYPGVKASRRTKGDGLDIDFYRQRLQELEYQYQHGLISEELFQNYRTELERELTLNLPKQANKVARDSKTQDIQITVFLLLIIPLFATLFYHFWGNSRELANWYNHEEHEKIIANELAELKTPEAVIAKFKTILNKHPDDPEGWYLLGRLYAAQGEYRLASECFAKSLSLKPDDRKITLNYIQALFFLNHNRLNLKTRALLMRILGEDPSNPIAINLLATDSFLSGHYQKAIAYWEVLIPYLDKKSRDYALTLSAIDKAKSKLSLHPKKLNSPQVEVTITLSPTLTKTLKLPVDLNLYAEAIKGPLFPLAVIKKQVSHFPVTFTLTEQHAMMPNATLTDYPEIRVVARFRSGQTQFNVQSGVISLMDKNKKTEAKERSMSESDYKTTKVNLLVQG